jgi:serine/threonine protein kinase
MRLNNMPENRKKEFEREISALMKLRPHQNLVNFMGVSLNNNELCIIMEFCFGGTLFEWLHKRKEVALNWKQRVKLATDIACGINYLHTCDPPIIHRDLKSLK